MLVLTRKRSESIRIGNDIVIKVIQTGRGMVKLGIEAPDTVRVLRAELTEFASAETPQVVTTGNMGTSHPASPHGNESHPVDISDDHHPIDFTTDFVMEVEDQMLCSVMNSH